MTLAQFFFLLLAAFLGGGTVELAGRGGAPTWLSWGLGFFVAMLAWLLLPQAIH